MKKNSHSNTVTSMPIYGSLVVVFCMLLSTLVKPLMGWVWVLCACAVAIAYMRIRRNLPSVKNVTLNLLAIFCVVLLIYLSSSFGLMATMVNLLVVAACLKLINLHSRADYHLVLIVLFFLIACGFIYHQNIYVVAYYFACIVVLFVIAFMLNKGQLSIQSSIQQSTKMILQALPITLALFVVVPRLPPFWQSNVETNTQTGLSEEITPGDIANLAQSDDLVFRAEFQNHVPLPQERYWRSIVLDYFDGKTWKMSRQHNQYNNVLKLNESNLVEQSYKNYRYLVVAEPNKTQWLYSLDTPIVEENMSSLSINMNRQYQLFQEEVNVGASLYILHSFPNAKLDAFVPETDFARYLQVPEDNNMQTRAWLRENVNVNMSFAEKLATINGLFTTNKFVYTLKPPLMLSAPVDEFLFQHQQGFCSHYASALTYMLRLANIPARMVAGYQGGNEQGDKILSVHQFDAHAWVEAYHSEKGWIRFDPTSLVAPNRTLSGLMSALNAQEVAVFNGERNGLLDYAMFDAIRDKVAVIDHKWNQFVLGFNNDSQSDLIERLFGELNRKNLMTFLLVTFAAIFIFLAVLFVPYKKLLKIKRKTAIEKLLLLLSKHQFVKNKQESLAQFSSRIMDQLPANIQSKLALFVEKYYAATYQSQNKISEEELDVIYKQIAKGKIVIATTKK